MGTVNDYKKFTNLSRVFNSSFGDSGEARVSSQSVKFRLLDDERVRVSYQSLVNINTPRMQEQLQHVFKTEGYSMIEAAIKKAKEDWKEQFPDAGELSITINRSTETDDLEFVHYSMHTSVKRAIFRLSVLAKVK